MPSAASIRQTWVVIEAALSFAGAGIAGTLWWADRTHQDVPCSANGGCEIVAASAWSHVDLIVFHHVPVALLGLLGYLALLTLAMLRLGSESDEGDRRLHRLIWLLAAGGAAYSWYLQWIAHAKIGAFCIWCRSSAFVMTALFLITTWEWWTARRKTQKIQRRLERHG
jgi:uncharacterized membrane protein